MQRGGALPARVVVAKSGGNYTTITAALNAITPTATNPYVIEVWPGVYTEPSTINLKSYVHLKGSGRDVTTVQTSIGTGADVIYAPGNTNVTISGLTITGGYHGIDFVNTSGAISENSVSNNSGNGITLYNPNVPMTSTHTVQITGNKVIGNLAGGIAAVLVNILVTDNVISGNGTTFANPGLYLNMVGKSNVSGNEIASNGYGINMYENSTPSISNNLIIDNVAGGIAYRTATAAGTLTNNKIVNNGGVDISASADGGLVQPNISFNISDYILGIAGVGSYNVNSNGDPILVP